MRLKEYIEYWSQIGCMDESELMCQIEEVSDLKTKVIKKSDSEWGFLIDKDLYTVRIGRKTKDHYEISFVYEGPLGSTSSITSKMSQFRVLDGVAVVIKEFIEEKNPNIIEFNIYDEKKSDTFERVMKMVLRKHRDIFGSFDVTKKKTRLWYDTDIKGIKFLLVKKI